MLSEFGRGAFDLTNKFSRQYTLMNKVGLLTNLTSEFPFRSVHALAKVRRIFRFLWQDEALKEFNIVSIILAGIGLHAQLN